MVYCAAFGCNNSAQKGNGISFFTFPKDTQLNKAWTHFCKRWNFVPGKGHRLCSDHFSSASFDIHPQKMKELGMQGVFKPRLKPRATPDVPLQSAELTKNGIAYEKRRKAEDEVKKCTNLKEDDEEKTKLVKQRKCRSRKVALAEPVYYHDLEPAFGNNKSGCLETQELETEIRPATESFLINKDGNYLNYIIRVDHNYAQCMLQVHYLNTDKIVTDTRNAHGKILQEDLNTPTDIADIVGNIDDVNVYEGKQNDDVNIYEGKQNDDVNVYKGKQNDDVNVYEGKQNDDAYYCQEHPSFHSNGCEIQHDEIQTKRIDSGNLVTESENEVHIKKEPSDNTIDHHHHQEPCSFHYKPSECLQDKIFDFENIHGEDVHIKKEHHDKEFDNSQYIHEPFLCHEVPQDEIKTCKNVSDNVVIIDGKEIHIKKETEDNAYMYNDNTYINNDKTYINNDNPYMYNDIFGENGNTSMKLCTLEDKISKNNEFMEQSGWKNVHNQNVEEHLVHSDVLKDSEHILNKPIKVKYCSNTETQCSTENSNNDWEVVLNPEWKEMNENMRIKTEAVIDDNIIQPVSTV